MSKKAKPARSPQAAMMVTGKDAILREWLKPGTPPWDAIPKPELLAAVAMLALRMDGLLRDNESARREADLRDEVSGLRSAMDALRETLATRCSQRDSLSVALSDAGITDDRIDEITNRCWVNVGRLIESLDPGSS